MTQPPLLTDANLAVLDLKGPIFKPRPGWGGRLNKRTAKLLNSNRFSLWLAVITFVLGFYSVLQYSQAQAAETFIIETVTVQPAGAARTSVYIEISAEPGQGSLQLARLALDEYLRAAPETILSLAQRAYVESYLARRIALLRIKPDENLVFDLALFQEAITKSLQFYK